MTSSAPSPLDHTAPVGSLLSPFAAGFADPSLSRGTASAFAAAIGASPPTPRLSSFHRQWRDGHRSCGRVRGTDRRPRREPALAGYRGYGLSTGTRHWPRCWAMCALLVEAAGVDPARLIFFGRSLGSLYAVHGAALFPGAAGLIVESRIADPFERILLRVTPSSWGCRSSRTGGRRQTRRSTASQARRVRGRTLIVQYRGDDLVPVSHAERLYAWAISPRKSFWSSRGGTTTPSSLPTRTPTSPPSASSSQSDR